MGLKISEGNPALLKDFTAGFEAGEKKGGWGGAKALRDGEDSFEETKERRE